MKIEVLHILEKEGENYLIRKVINRKKVTNENDMKCVTFVTFLFYMFDY